jgi:hypothetical protein
MLYRRNKEGFANYNLPDSLWEGRQSGLSAFVRLADEEEWVRPSIESILPWCDEIVCTLQCSTDQTEQILRSFDSEKISIYHYPFKSWPNGPGHDKQPEDSLYNNAYFYNWSLGLTTRKWVMKWDGDMVAHDWLGPTAWRAMESYDVIFFSGTNLVHGLKHKSAMQPIIKEGEPRIFRMSSEVHYCNGPFSQKLKYSPKRKTCQLPGESYLHFKWAKESCYQGWPEDWEKWPHFQRIAERVKPGEKYNGPIPRALKGIL